MTYALRPLEFDGQRVPVLVHGDRQRWSAANVSTLMGYSRPSDLGELIRDEWAAEFKEGKDFEVKTRDEVTVQYPVTSGSDFASKFAPSVMLLTETGILLALCKTDRPAGVRFRRWLVDVALPALRRGTKAADPALVQARELRQIAAALPKADRRAVLVEAARRMGVEVPAEPAAIPGRPVVGPIIAAARDVLASGRNVSSTALARRLGITPSAVGSALNAAGWLKKKRTDGWMWLPPAVGSES